MLYQLAKDDVIKEIHFLDYCLDLNYCPWHCSSWLCTRQTFAPKCSLFMQMYLWWVLNSALTGGFTVPSRTAALCASPPLAQLWASQDHEKSQLWLSEQYALLCWLSTPLNVTKEKKENFRILSLCSKVTLPSSRQAVQKRSSFVLLNSNNINMFGFQCKRYS